MTDWRGRIERWLDGGGSGEPELSEGDLSLDAEHVVERQGVGVDFLFVDVREAVEVAATGGIVGAEHVPVGEIDRAAPSLPRGVVVVCYCASGVRSLRAARRLRAAGHPAAFSLAGGLAAYQRAGGDVDPA